MLLFWRYLLMFYLCKFIVLSEMMTETSKAASKSQWNENRVKSCDKGARGNCKDTGRKKGNIQSCRCDLPCIRLDDCCNDFIQTCGEILTSNSSDLLTTGLLKPQRTTKTKVKDLASTKLLNTQPATHSTTFKVVSTSPVSTTKNIVESTWNATITSTHPQIHVHHTRAHSPQSTTPEMIIQPVTIQKRTSLTPFSTVKDNLNETTTIFKNLPSASHDVIKHVAITRFWSTRGITTDTVQQEQNITSKKEISRNRIISNGSEFGNAGTTGLEARHILLIGVFSAAAATSSALLVCLVCCVVRRRKRRRRQKNYRESEY